MEEQRCNGRNRDDCGNEANAKHPWAKGEERRAGTKAAAKRCDGAPAGEALLEPSQCGGQRHERQRQRRSLARREVHAAQAGEHQRRIDVNAQKHGCAKFRESEHEDDDAREHDRWRGRGCDDEGGCAPRPAGDARGLLKRRVHAARADGGERSHRRKKAAGQREYAAQFAEQNLSRRRPAKIAFASE